MATTKAPAYLPRASTDIRFCLPHPTLPLTTRISSLRGSFLGIHSTCFETKTLGLQLGPQLLTQATSVGDDMQIIKPYSEDLRIRLVQAVEGGMSKSAVARLFGVSLSSVKRYSGSPSAGEVAGAEEGRRKAAED